MLTTDGGVLGPRAVHRRGSIGRPTRAWLGRRAIIAAALVFAAAPRSWAAPGDLDGTFGAGGIVEIPVATSIAWSKLAVQGDGKVVAVAARDSGGVKVLVSRYDSLGDLDPTWNGTGEVIGPAGLAVGVAVQPDGKVLVAFVAGGDALRILRYDALGNPDPSWGTAGTLLTSISLAGNGFEAGTILVAQPDGKVLVGGELPGSFALARYDSTGNPDPSFGGTGLVTTPLASTNGVKSIALQSDAKIVAVGESDDQIAVARYFPTGTPDPGFGGGVVITAVATSRDDFARDVAIQADGKILVAANDNLTASFEPSKMVTVRYLDDGELDASWGGTGVVVTEPDGPTGIATTGAIVVQGDGKVYLLGGSSTALPDLAADFVIARFDPTGTPDPTWGGTGIVRTDLGSPVDYVNDAALQPDRKLVAAGYASDAPGFAALARYDVGEFCGDGIVQASEECDDANPADGDCCSSTCTLEPAGSTCTDDGDACTADECDGEGACEHTPLVEGASCEDGNDCTEGETCTGGICSGGVPGDSGCLNPFVCYKTKPTQGEPRFDGEDDLALVDELESGSFDAKTQFELCVPAEVNDLEILDPSIRQIVYKIKPSPGQPKHEQQQGIEVMDHFGVHSLDTKGVDLLLVPASLSLVAPTSPPPMGSADHYKCYKVKQAAGAPRFKQSKVFATEELESRFYDVFQPRRLCYPVEKNGEPVVDPSALLTCYRLRRQNGQPVHERLVGVHAADQFGALRLDTNPEKDLCLPATLLP